MTENYTFEYYKGGEEGCSRRWLSLEACLTPRWREAERRGQGFVYFYLYLYLYLYKGESETEFFNRPSISQRRHNSGSKVRSNLQQVIILLIIRTVITNYQNPVTIFQSIIHWFTVFFCSRESGYLSPGPREYTSNFLENLKTDLVGELLGFILELQ